MKLALGHRAVAEEARGHPLAALQLVGERKADRERQSAADDRVAAVEPGGRVKQVHRPATSARAALDLAVHLGHDRAGRDAADQRVTVLAIRGDDRVLRRERLHRTDRDGLLADVQVHEPADLGGAVELHALLLEPAHPKHLPQQLEAVLAVDLRGRAHDAGSSVEVSPSASPSSRAFSSLRMTLPLRL